MLAEAQGAWRTITVVPEANGFGAAVTGLDLSRPLPPDWARIRRRILRRDNGDCYLCGKPGSNGVDHIVPAIDGGTDDDDNLASVHERPCHAVKTAREANAHNPKAQPRRATACSSSRTARSW